MYDLGWMTPAWASVLDRTFPGPRREKEIKAVSKILRALHNNNSTSASTTRSLAAA